MRYPALIVDLRKIEQNTKAVVAECKKHGISVTAVSKCYLAMPEIVEAQIRGGVDMLADSRLKNIKRLKNYPLKKMLIRIPMISEVDDIVKFADYSMNSEFKTIKALSDAAIKHGEIHKIIFMVDIGDLREGCLPENALPILSEIVKLKGILLDGIAANFGCFGGVMPDYNNLSILVKLANDVKEKFGINVSFISGGNSFTYTAMVRGECPKEINHFRFGDILLTGYDSRLEEVVPGAERDAVTLMAELIEIYSKPSKPSGNIEKDAFGVIPHFEDKGIRKRAIFAVGRQDVRFEEVVALRKGMEILGASSDHMIVDVTDCEEEYNVGDIVPFRLTYGAMMMAFNSEYVEKVFVK
jgi:predicted amino acid racemase